MKRSFVLLLLLAPAALAQQELYWHSNYEEALAEAKETGKPIFLEYRCSP